jgi:hypothetical protein
MSAFYLSNIIRNEQVFLAYASRRLQAIDDESSCQCFYASYDLMREKKIRNHRRKRSDYDNNWKKHDFI